ARANPPLGWRCLDWGASRTPACPDARTLPRGPCRPRRCIVRRVLRLRARHRLVPARDRVVLLRETRPRARDDRDPLRARSARDPLVARAAVSALPAARAGAPRLRAAATLRAPAQHRARGRAADAEARLRRARRERLRRRARGPVRRR